MCFSADIGIIYSTHRTWISRLHSDCKAVCLFTMNFTKAFDSVNHSKLSAKLSSFRSILPESIGAIASCFSGNSEFLIIITFVTGKPLTREPHKDA